MYPVPPTQCWDITEQLRPQTFVLLNIGPEAGEEGKKKEVKTATFPTGCFTGSRFKDFFLGFEVPRELAKFLC